MRRLLHLLGNIPEDEFLLSLYSSRKSLCNPYFKRLLIPSYRLPRWLSGKGPNGQCWKDRRYRLDSWVGKIPWSRKWEPTLVLLSTWTEEPGRLQSIRSQRVRHDLVTEHTHTHTHTHTVSYTIFCYSEKGRKFLYKHILDRLQRYLWKFYCLTTLGCSSESRMRFPLDSPWILFLFSHCSGWKSSLHDQELHLPPENCESLLSSFAQ